MRPWKRSSKSTSRERLYLQGSRDKASGLMFAGRIFIPEKEKKPQPFLWFFSDALILLFVISGLFLLMITGFSLEVYAAFFPILLAECVAATVLCRTRWKTWIGVVLLFLVLIGTAVALFFVQEEFLAGARSFYIQMRTTLNQTYNESESELHMVVGNAKDMAVFLSFTGWGAALWIAFSIFGRENFLLAMLLLCPVIAAIVLCGGGNNVLSLFLLMFGILGCLSLTRTVRHKRLWGEGNAALFAQNRQRHQRIQKKNLLLVYLMTILLTIPGFYLVRPMLSVRLHPAEKVAMRVQSTLLSKALAVLPDITADQWNLEVKTVGGGVSDGALQDVDGYLLQGVEELRLAVTEKPTETIYLKGYVGSRYTGNSWEGGYDTSFDGASMNWRIRSNPRLYIQNLAFLRTAYVMDQIMAKGSDAAGDAGGEAAGDGATGGTGDASSADGGAGTGDNSSTTGGAGSDTADGMGDLSSAIDDAGRGESISPTMAAMMAYNSEPAMITVEKLNANPNYTYVPYGVFLNDYYKVLNGDGAVEGQHVNDDSYYFYYREEMEEILKTWMDMENKTNVLDRVEESYRIFCRNNYMQVDEQLSELQERVQRVIKEEKFDPEFDMNHIIAWVRAFLAENYEYDVDLEALEEGEDFLHTFLYEKKKGYSIHFASAAVQLFRMFGIPARYVVGYEAPAAIFTVQPDGTYTATLQDDNSQAWAEIYISGIGWKPVDVTPGMVGTLEEVGPGGEKIQTYEYQDDNLKIERESEEEETEKQPIPQRVLGSLTERINAFLNTELSVEQVVQFMVLIILLVIALILFALIYRRICRNYGFDPFHRRSKLERILGIFSAYYRFLEKKGLQEGTDSASLEFISYASAYLNKKKREKDVIPLSQMRDRIYAFCFGDVPVEDSDIRKMRRLYRSLVYRPAKNWLD